MLVRFKNAESGRWLARDHGKIIALPPDTKPHFEMTWIFREDKYLENPITGRKLYAKPEEKWGANIDKDFGVGEGDDKNMRWQLEKKGNKVVIENRETKRRFFAKGDSFGAMTGSKGAKDQEWEMITVPEKFASLENMVHIILWNKIEDTAEKQKISWKDAAMSMGFLMQKLAKEIPWKDLRAKAESEKISLKEAAKLYFAEPSMSQVMKDKFDEIPWDEIAEKAKKTGVSMKAAAVDMGVSMKDAVEDIPWDEIAAKAKSMGVSMKEAAKKIPWDDMARKAKEMGKAVKDKFDEIPWDEIAEKAKKTGVSMKAAAVDMGVSMKDAVEDIPWDEISAKAKSMGVSIKEAAKKIPWDDMMQSAWEMGEAIQDKLEDVAEAAQEKASSWCSCCDAPKVDKKNEVILA